MMTGVSPLDDISSLRFFIEALKLKIMAVLRQTKTAQGPMRMIISEPIMYAFHPVVFVSDSEMDQQFYSTPMTFLGALSFFYI